jgi:FAD/FMN-containing dehydrogenase
MVSTNASGAHSLRYGSIRRWVRGLTVITSDGVRTELRRGVKSPLPVPREELLAQRELIRARFPRVSKNSAGYALDAWVESGDDLDLLIGSEGTLAVVTEIEWRLAPIPACRAGIRVQLKDLDRLDGAVEAILQQEPSAVELLDRTFLELVERGGVERGAVVPGHGLPESILLVELEGGDAAGLEQRVSRVVRSLDGLAAEIEIALTPEEEARVWRLRHAASPIIADLPRDRRSLQVIEDACVPRPAMGAYIAGVRALSSRLDVPVVIFGHAGDGNIHVNLLPRTGRPGWEDAVETLYREITGLVIRLGGTTSGEHGDGRIRSPVLEQLYGPEILRLFHRIKKALDPRGILNPGVKLGPATDPLRGLKVGANAAVIPEAIAGELRDIERKGDYLRNRLGDPSLRSG